MDIENSDSPRSEAYLKRPGQFLKRAVNDEYSTVNIMSVDIAREGLGW